MTPICMEFIRENTLAYKITSPSITSAPHMIEIVFSMSLPQLLTKAVVQAPSNSL